VTLLPVLFVRIQAYMTVSSKIVISGDMTPCSLVDTKFLKMEKIGPMYHTRPRHISEAHNLGVAFVVILPC
jgi:hypothetical protein